MGCKDSVSLITIKNKIILITLFVVHAANESKKLLLFLEFRLIWRTKFEEKIHFNLITK
jgi:hypothetical protein